MAVWVLVAVAGGSLLACAVGAIGWELAGLHRHYFGHLKSLHFTDAVLKPRPGDPWILGMAHSLGISALLRAWRLLGRLPGFAHTTATPPGRC